MLSAKNPSVTFRLLQEGKLPARKVGKRWVSERKMLQRHVMPATQPPSTRAVANAQKQERRPVVQTERREEEIWYEQYTFRRHVRQQTTPR